MSEKNVKDKAEKRKVENKDKESKRTASPVPQSLKESERKRRQVFKPILDNPFTQSNIWPFVGGDVGKDIVDMLKTLLADIGNYNEAKSRAKAQQKSAPDVPEIMNKVTIGFNSTVGKLENQASIYRSSIMGKKEHIPEGPMDVKYVFVAKLDIKPALLTEHFPVLTYTASKSEQERVKLIQLPKGSMDVLSGALGKANSGFIGMPETITGAEPLYNMINANVSDVSVPWLEGLLDNKMSSYYAAPATKLISTSVPVGKGKKKGTK